MVAQPVRLCLRHGVQCYAECLCHHFDATEQTQRSEHVRGIGALLAPRREIAALLARCEQRIEQQTFSGTPDQTRTKP